MLIANFNNTIEVEEEEEEDSDNILYLDNKLLQRLKLNDPTVTYLCVPLHCDEDSGECFFNKIDWKIDGDCIANNTHIKKLSITYHGRPNVRRYILGEEGHNLPTRQQLQDFFSCINRNSSIKTIGIFSTSIIDDFGGSLIEVIRDHPSLVRLEIGHAKLGSIVCTAIGEVLKHPASKVKNLSLINSQLDDEGVRRLTDVLVGNSRMKTLCINSTLLLFDHNRQRIISNCKLVELDLYSTGINDEGANMLGETLSNGSSVKALNIGYNHSISSSGWNALINQLPHTSIVSLNLSSNNIDDAGLAALVNIGALECLDLRDNSRITPTGWQSFFNSLQQRGTQLVKLDISYNKVGDKGTAALGRLLSNMNTLKELDIGGMSYPPNNITSQGWVSLFTTLHGSNLDLADLNLGSNNIDDEGMQLLIPFVSRMRSLKELRLNDNRSVTPTGWLGLSRLLQSPNSALRQLDLDNNNLIDDVIVAFSSALVHNKTLKRLSLYGCLDDDDNDLITERGWDAISTLLCNKTSIMDTYSSNHILQSVCFDQYNEPDIPFHLKSYLELNGNKDKVEVARQKILQTYFSDDDTSNIQELLDMELKNIPTVIAWIGWPVAIHWSGMNMSGLSTMYNLMRRLPDLFDSSPQKKSGRAKTKHETSI